MQQMVDRAGGISLRQVVPEAQFFGGQDIRVRSCSGEAAACREGDLFVALVGSDEDGHDRVCQAIEHGATAVLAERLLPVRVPVCVVADTRKAYGQLCQSLAGHPSDTLELVGVTGTHGKTTTSMLIASVLHTAGRQVGVTSTLGHSDSYEMAPSQRTTPVPPELATWLARMAANGCSHGVVEASSCALAQHRLAGVRLSAAVLTNLRRDHVDYHGSVLNYRSIKQRLFAHLKEPGFAVINVDDPGSRMALSRLACPVITVGMLQEAEVTATVVERHPSEQTFLLSAGQETAAVRTRMIGDQHVANCLCAAAVGLVMQIDLTTVVRGLEAVTRIPNRLERIECGQPFHVYVDCADSADRLAVGLKTLRRVTKGRLYCVVGVNGDHRLDERPLVGRTVERAADLGILTSGCEPSGHRMEAIHDMLDGYDRPARAHVIPSRRQAILWALEQAQPGDTVLIAASHRDRGLAGSDHRALCKDTELARRWLYQSAGETAPALGVVAGGK